MILIYIDDMGSTVSLQGGVALYSAPDQIGVCCIVLYCIIPESFAFCCKIWFCVIQFVLYGGEYWIGLYSTPAHNSIQCPSPSRERSMVDCIRPTLAQHWIFKELTLAFSLNLKNIKYGIFELRVTEDLNIFIWCPQSPGTITDSPPNLLYSHIVGNPHRYPQYHNTHSVDKPQ